MAARDWTSAAQKLELMLSADNLTAADLLGLDDLIALGEWTTDTFPGLHHIQQTHLVHRVGLLLRRILDQRQVSPSGWQQEGYCFMVQKTANAAVAALRCGCSATAPANVRTTAILSCVKQLTACGVLPRSAAAMQHLVQLIQTAAVAGLPQTGPTVIEAASALLHLAATVIAVWPGSAGVVTSKSAGPIVQPSLQLAGAFLQYVSCHRNAADLLCALQANNTMIDNLNIEVAMLTTNLSYDSQQRQQQLQQQPLLQQLLRSPQYLRLLLTRAAVFAGQMLLGKEVVEPAADERTPAAASGTISTAAGKAHNSNSSKQHLVLLLQTMYPESSSSRWDTALHAACSDSGQSVSATEDLSQVLMMITDCIHELQDDLMYLVLQGCSCSETASSASSSTSSSSHHSSSSSSRSTNSQQQLSSSHNERVLAQLSNLQVLRLLPMLLLQTLAAVDATTRDGGNLHLMVCHAIRVVFKCWWYQLQITDHPAGVTATDLHAAELLQQLLQKIRLLLQQVTSATASEGTKLTAKQTSEGEATAVAAEELVKPDDSLILLLELLSDFCRLNVRTAWKHLTPQVAAVLEHCIRSSQEHSNGSGGSSDHRDDSISSRDDMASSSTETMQQEKQQDAGSAGCRKTLKLCEELLCPVAADVADDILNDSACRVPGPLVLEAALAQPGSREQQQLFRLLTSLLKAPSSRPDVNMGRTLACADAASGAISSCSYEIVWNLADLMLEYLQSSSTSSSDRTSLSAATPWFLLLSRVLLYKAAQLPAYLNHQPATPAPDAAADTGQRAAAAVHPPVHEHQLPSVPLPADHDSIVQYLLPLQHWIDCTRGAAVSLQSAIEQCCGPDIDSSSSSSAHLDRSALDPEEQVDTASTTAQAAAVATVAAIAGSSFPAADAVRELQQSRLLLCAGKLQNVCVPKLGELGHLCTLIASGVGAGAIQQVMQQADSAATGFSSEVQEAIQGVDSIEGFKKVLSTWGIHQLQQQMSDVAQQMCAVLPHICCCNNPVCSNVSSSSEWDLVSGKSCVCGGCETARYCSRDCQAAHWQQHKRICKVIKRQKRGVPS